MVKAKLEFSKRLKEAYLAAGMTGSLRKKGKEFGVSSSMVWEMEHAETMPSMETAARMANRLGVSVDWLMTGRGEKQLSATMDQEMLALFSALDAADVRRVKDFVRGLAAAKNGD